MSLLDNYDRSLPRKREVNYKRSDEGNRLKIIEYRKKGWSLKKIWIEILGYKESTWKDKAVILKRFFKSDPLIMERLLTARKLTKTHNIVTIIEDIYGLESLDKSLGKT